mmetsp:Transcript_9015/g.23636  ORF Transcript_9015/g.23636 Transcript_9015/m.23636 type:complete len:246 (+) Transcript_9015:56-793(+)
MRCAGQSCAAFGVSTAFLGTSSGALGGASAMSAKCAERLPGARRARLNMVQVYEPGREGARTEAGAETLGAPRSLDWFRETPLRFLGYANECGESFRFFIGSHGVLLTYGLAFLYVASDSVYQAVRESHSAQQDADVHAHVKQAKLFLVAMDSLMWQSFASVVIPGYVINRVVYASNYMVHQLSSDLHFGATVEHWLPTAIGMLAIPVIVKPIDELVHKAMDVTVRPASNALLHRIEHRSRQKLD